jgi:phosphoribosylanthranilate isomerase
MFVKICGITNEEDALLSVAMGATAIGFVFAPSKRQISVGRCADIVKRLPPGIITVGVFRDHDVKSISRIMRETGLRGVQLHGRETVSEVDTVTAEFGWVMKAVVAGSRDAQQCDRYRTDLILFDAANPGSGETYDWSLLADVPKGVRCVVSGGLNAENVAEAIATTKPYGVDVSSGVEREPGQKDAAKVRRFVQNAIRAFEDSTAHGDAEEHHGS